jgi:hypothetical protein
MTTAKDYDVIDKHGKRVTRVNGVLQDGDSIRVRMNLMDAANPALAHAAAVADALKRAEAFDARQHRPGFVATQDAYDAGDAAREARDALVRDAWRKPAPVIDEAKPIQPAAIVPPTASKEQLFAAADQAAAERDRRLESAWKS